MSDETRSPQAANIVKQGMADIMTRRRVERPERRGVGTSRFVRRLLRFAKEAESIERRQTCRYCFRRGDHLTPGACLRALERSE